MAVERKSYSAVLWAILLVAAFTSIMPFGWIIAGSFKPHLEIQKGRVWPWQGYQPSAGEAASSGQQSATTQAAQPEQKYVTGDNYKTIFSELSGLPTYYFNTIYLAVCGTFMALLIGSLAAYGFARFRFIGNKALFSMLLLTIMIPAEVMLIGQFELMFQLRLYDKIVGLLAAYTAENLLLIIFIMRNVFVSIPQDLVDAAMIDGAGTWRIFWDMMVPIGRNGMAAAAILTFLAIWNEFLFALTFTSMEKVRTLPVGIVLLKSQWGMMNSGTLFSTVLLSFLPIVIVFLLLQKYFVRGLSAGALKA